MNKIVLAVIAGASLCVLSACSTYTEANGPNGGAVKHIAIALGTSITTSNGCINSAGGTCDQQTAPAAE
ncbi:hypothetical protein C3369_11285 [Escherichia sp. ESNIH1]|nr:hypothetical protein C3369_11285 [Escherichia sp. ESNIH1]